MGIIKACPTHEITRACLSGIPMISLLCLSDHNAHPRCARCRVQVLCASRQNKAGASQKVSERASGGVCFMNESPSAAPHLGSFLLPQPDARVGAQTGEEPWRSQPPMNPSSAPFPSVLHDRFIPAGPARQDPPRWVQAEGRDTRQLCGHHGTVFTHRLAVMQPRQYVRAHNTRAVYSDTLFHSLVQVEKKTKSLHAHTTDSTSLPVG